MYDVTHVCKAATKLHGTVQQQESLANAKVSAQHQWVLQV